nr:nuclear transport factor 2 family protein [Mycolicibacter kumamotonensis]
MDYFEMFFNQHRIDEAVDNYQAPSYIQHNPALPNGPEALKTAMKSLVAQFPDLRFDVKRAFADGDYVIVHSEMTGLNWVLDGADTPSAGAAGGETPSYAVVDILRMEDGRIAEHWDVIQRVPEQPAGGNSMF